MKTVESIMTKTPCCCTPDTKLPDVAKLMIKYDCGEIPIVDDYKNLRIMGVITDRDIVCRSVAKDMNPRFIPVADIMTFPPITVTPSTSVEKCCELMKANHIRRIPVVDDFDRICGIITQADIIRKSHEDTMAVLREISEPKPSTDLAN